MACGRCPGGGGGNPSNPTCGANCLRAANITIPCSDNTVPCTGVFSQSLVAGNASNNGGCVENGVACGITYQILSYSSDLSNVTLSEAGLLEGEVNSTAVPNTIAVIRYRRYCDCNSLAATGKVFVCIKDICVNVSCGDDTECNKCTGECDPVIPNAILS